MSCNPSTIVSHLSAFSRLLLISILFLLIPAYAKQTGIPGCADIDNLEETFNFETSSLNDLLLCFCKIKTDSSVAISCLYGSSLEDLNKAISLVADANATVDEHQKDSRLHSYISFAQSRFLPTAIPLTLLWYNVAMLLEQHRAFFSYWLQLPASLHIRIGLFEELQRIEIDGCADIDNLEETFNFETSSLNDLLLCFCKIKTDSSVAISCLYGSSLEDLNKAISLVADANATVDEIVLSHMEFNETGLPDDFFNRNAARLKTLSIGKPVYVGPREPKSFSEENLPDSEGDLAEEEAKQKSSLNQLHQEVVHCWTYFLYNSCPPACHLYSLVHVLG
ncbi:hypothetical protein Tcan_13109 [Toxocara canis]|uniref:Uncharacterized protein n=1 Tax=Toxocara canis TaxID=6265 RepID=A0A0B2UNU7_TOXCA|nr:hypothetical protein Tcan_13109 [Toxocara canis]